jgi:epoxyqueuosine reductase
MQSEKLLAQLQIWAQSLGFSHIGIAPVDLKHAKKGFSDWLAQGFAGDMYYLQKHRHLRFDPTELLPGTISIITLGMDYLPMYTPVNWKEQAFGALSTPQQGVVSFYARGRDYHKVLRQRLQKLVDKLSTALQQDTQSTVPLVYRVFTDSAPVMEVELACLAGMGWRGKHTLLLNEKRGSLFFLGEIFVNMALTPGRPVRERCGSCTACINICPTQAIIAPYQLDARRCISYLTIEHQGSIPLHLRPLIGNRIYGCDDCQLICPWNKYAKLSTLNDFNPKAIFRHHDLVSYFRWTQEDFLRHTTGTAIRRIGYSRWLRNVAVALGNALAVEKTPQIRQTIQRTLQQRLDDPSDMVKEHTRWALEQGDIKA